MIHHEIWCKILYNIPIITPGIKEKKSIERTIPEQLWHRQYCMRCIFFCCEINMLLLNIFSHPFNPQLLPFFLIISTGYVFLTGDMTLAFCLSMLVGLLLGALVYILLTWASRRRATAMITRRSKTRSRTSQTNSPLGGQIGLYRSTFLSVYRQPSLDPVGPLGSKPNLETSTFRPVPKRSRAPLDMGEDTQIDVAEDTAASNASDSESLVPNKRHSFWLGSNGLKGFLTSPAPPPAYDSVIHAFEETCTWDCLQKYDKKWGGKGLKQGI